ncbi:hypothetical protein DFH09DRAFT_1096816 [Mycena vulgaris]|nr:hypothetical protein DFH09DRAFT_1096816 [Mycena vulgaris]
MERGCKNPHLCAVAVRTRLDQLFPKWDPRSPDIPPVRANDDPGRPQTFRPPPEISSLSDGFRVFTKTTAAEDNVPPHAPPAVAGNNTPARVAISSLYEHAGTLDTCGAAGVWYGPNDVRNTGTVLPPAATPNKSGAEIVAALLAAQTAPANAPLHIVSKGSLVISAMNKNLQKWEENGWIGVPNPAPARTLAGCLRNRPEPTIFEKSVGVADSVLCPNATGLARGVLASESAAPVNLSIPGHLEIKGAKLSSITRVLAYRGIRDLKSHPSRKATDENIALIQSAAKSLSGHAPQAAKIW